MTCSRLIFFTHQKLGFCSYAERDTHSSAHIACLTRLYLLSFSIVWQADTKIHTASDVEDGSRPVGEEDVHARAPQA